MAGYIYALGHKQPIDIYLNSVKNGIFSTFISTISSIPFEGTLADYVTMQEGDNVYFFFERKLYGIGELVKIGPDCKYSNYLGACKLEKFSLNNIRQSQLVNYNSASNRWICLFKPSPFFFRKGIDMDDVLNYRPSTFKMLRAFWKTSFIKIDDEENQSLKEILLLRNQEALESPCKDNMVLYQKDAHKQLETKVTIDYKIDLRDLLASCNSKSKINHEMAIEAATLHRLSIDFNTLFGKWDYLSHQVPASPFKPIDYMDRIDILAYRFLENTRIISKYMVIEIKKDIADIAAISQLAKYIDWVCLEYAYGDYSLIEGYVLAHSFSQQAIEKKYEICERNYTQGSHPIENKLWKEVELVRYQYTGKNLEFFPV